MPSTDTQELEREIAAILAPNWMDYVDAQKCAGQLVTLLRSPAERGEGLNPEEIAAQVVQSIADSEPDEDTIEAQEILRGTPYEMMYVLNGDVIERHVAMAVENAIYDARLASPPAPVEGRQPCGDECCDNGILRTFDPSTDGKPCEACARLNAPAPVEGTREAAVAELASAAAAMLDAFDLYASTGNWRRLKEAVRALAALPVQGEREEGEPAGGDDDTANRTPQPGSTVLEGEDQEWGLFTDSKGRRWDWGEAEEDDDEDGSVRCTCEWADPANGHVDAVGPMEVDRRCRVHGARGGWPLEGLLEDRALAKHHREHCASPAPSAPEEP